jgi:hypothetical protein
MLRRRGRLFLSQSEPLSANAKMLKVWFQRHLKPDTLRQGAQQTPDISDSTEALVFSGSARLFTCIRQVRFYAGARGPDPPVAAEAPSLL